MAEIVVDGSITDVDDAPPALEAIAITSVDNSGGTWEYQLEGESTWTTIAASGAASLLLGPADKVRFVPAADFNGESTFAFRAWDQSDGKSPGETADTTANGGITAYSSTGDTASITIDPINDAPEGTDTTVTTLENVAYPFVEAS